MLCVCDMSFPANLSSQAVIRLTGRIVLFGNAVIVKWVFAFPTTEMKYHFKNGQGDECYLYT